MSVPLTRRRFTVEEYYRMAEAGILGEDDRVEPLDGEIVDPGPDGYREVRRLGRGDRTAPQALPDLVLSVDDALA